MRRLLIRVNGVVQGVGFRPRVHELARRVGLSGFVHNDGDGVHIEVEGESDALQQFRDEMMIPTGATRIVEVRVEDLALCGGHGFTIEPSRGPTGEPDFIPADIATCSECLRELFDPADRRHHYPFISCSACGPRFTVISEIPYDRERTTMAAFPLCLACRREYEDPWNRRFHAQTTACPACGPRLAVLDSIGRSTSNVDPLTAAVAALKDGRIVAIKGLGGFHLACDARNEAAVAELRLRKGRDVKPFAVMVADLDAARACCAIAPAEAELLQSPECPIVLLRKRPDPLLAHGIAPGNACVGVMLPYTPLHHLLLRDCGGPLVMTSGNRSDEPIAFDDADAVHRLAGIADLFLMHDRPIRTRCDDSVMRVVAGKELPVRRSRGFAPQPLMLPVSCPRPVLAVGGHLKAAFALGRGRYAIPSHHLGDLDEYESTRAFAEAVGDYERLFRFTPEVIAHDLHPDYASTRFALSRAAETGAKLVAVQHHHAHMAACMAENGLNEPVIGVTFDGAGYGPDGTIWGGEFLVGDYRSFRRAAHLRPVRLPGGDRAVREPWRVALAHLLDAGLSPDLLAGRIDALSLRTVTAMIERGVNAPPSSSAGRLFDAVASLVGLRDRVGYEGQAAIELEALAAEAGPHGTYPFALTSPGEPIQVDSSPVTAAVAADVRANVAPAVIARRFHATLVEVIAAVCGQLRYSIGLDVVVLSGGVFLNAILLVESLDRLTRDGFRTYRHGRVPPGDGGLCLGQLVVAAARES